MDIRNIANEYEDYIIRLRRYFHQNPETSWNEYNTTEFIENELRKLNIKVKRLKKTGAIGIIDGRNRENMLALRAEMDALPIKENTNLPFKATNGCMHACGHDTHMAMLLGAARILTKIKDKLNGSVKLIFQPSEENGTGAETIIKQDNVLSDVEAIFGMHVFAMVRSGKLNIESGVRMASADTFKITVEGIASHGSIPNLGIDAILASSAIVMNLQSIVSRNISPMDSAVVTIGTINGGDNYNIIANKVVMTGTTRAFSKETRKLLEEKVRNIVKTTADTYGAHAELEYNLCPPPLINDNKLTEIARKSAVKLFGKDVLVPVEKMTVGEDFANYLEEVPGVFVFIGGGSEKVGMYSNHNDKFDVEESSLKMGSALYAQFALDFLNNCNEK
ncbi:amidohydrolase [Clostridium fermenticellae]|uniref:Amidohydrolase n=1 Tax=Clostridium fermenticellae TaxID=2068654 RepID=A0A386H3S3_9CLOT|nr:amidohydrolase [Clostridium fermenticellae]AYD40342.1 amidohydrolase [Clostridium fermenticellae]